MDKPGAPQEKGVLVSVLPHQLSDFSISSEAGGERVVVTVTGELDVHSAPQLREHLAAVATAGAREVVVDLTGTEFIDSTGIGVIVGALRRLRGQQGSLRLRGVSTPMLRVFQLTGLTRMMEIDLRGS